MQVAYNRIYLKLVGRNSTMLIVLLNSLFLSLFLIFISTALQIYTSMNELGVNMTHLQKKLYLYTLFV